MQHEPKSRNETHSASLSPETRERTPLHDVLEIFEPVATVTEVIFAPSVDDIHDVALAKAGNRG